jgi:flagellar motor switch protein FliG
MGISIKDIAKLTGTQKVAMVLLSLSDDNATKVFSLM